MAHENQEAEDRSSLIAEARDKLIESLQISQCWRGDDYVDGFNRGIEIALESVPATTVIREQRSTLHYGAGIKNCQPSNVASTFGFDSHDWHQSASGDTGTSHLLPGRLYIVQCQWCYEAFAALTKDEAMEMFRAHEEETNSVLSSGQTTTNDEEK